MPSADLRHPLPTVVTLMGPTASGKTDIALQLAEQVDVTLISVDSAMIYRGMDIGTAKPSKEILQRYPHELVDIRDPWESYSARAFLDGADSAVRLAFAQNRLPVLVGGAFLYFRAFRDGLSNLPGADAEVRRHIQKRARLLGWGALHYELGEIDSIAASKIHPNNHARIERALEVYELTGKPISDHWRSDAGRNARSRLRCELLEYGISNISRAVLHQRIERRLDRMIDHGLLDEVSRVREVPHVSRESLSMRAVGYQQCWEFLDSGSNNRASLREKILVATRRLARQQCTWLRQWGPFISTAPNTAVNRVMVDIADKK